MLALVSDSKMEFHGGITAYMNLVSACIILKVVFADMLNNDVPEHMLQKIIDSELSKLIPSAREAVAELKAKGG